MITVYSNGCCGPVFDMSFVRYIVPALRVPAGARVLSRTIITARNVVTSATATAAPKAGDPIIPWPGVSINGAYPYLLEILTLLMMHIKSVK